MGETTGTVSSESSAGGPGGTGRLRTLIKVRGIHSDNNIDPWKRMASLPNSMIRYCCYF